MSKAPCKDCPDRHLGCHSQCEKYKAYTEERKRISDLRMKNRNADWDYYEVRSKHRRKDY